MKTKKGIENKSFLAMTEDEARIKVKPFRAVAGIGASGAEGIVPLTKAQWLANKGYVEIVEVLRKASNEEEQDELV